MSKPPPKTKKERPPKSAEMAARAADAVERKALRAKTFDELTDQEKDEALKRVLLKNRVIAPDPIE